MWTQTVLAVCLFFILYYLITNPTDKEIFILSDLSAYQEMTTNSIEDENSVEYVNYLLTLDAIPNIIITIVYLLLGIVGNSFVIYVYAFATKSVFHGVFVLY
jgi:hypothetical protein